MLAREYNKRISVYQVESIPDGFGGNTVVKTVLAESWAKLVNQNTSIQQRATGLGITDLYEPLIFKLRYRNDLPYNGRNLYLSYQGEDYVIKSITDNNEFHREIEILCTKTIPETVPLITLNTSFPFTLPLTLS
jgi:SPP1 family predicted phage head-tail adaptor